MNNIKATFADTRGHARRGSQRPPPPIGPRATPTCCASRIRRQTRQTAFPIHTAFHTLRKRPQRQPSDDGRAHFAQTINSSHFDRYRFVKNPALKRRVFARRTKNGRLAFACRHDPPSA